MDKQQETAPERKSSTSLQRYLFGVSVSIFLQMLEQNVYEWFIIYELPYKV